MIFRLVELFCGPDGIAKEATSANINNPKWGIIHQWANDYDKDTCKTYIRNICHDRPDSVVCGDIRTLDFERLYQLDICKVSLLTADGKETGFGSDLNWGIRQNGTKRNRDQAYIPYNSQDKKDGFFPLKQNINIKHNPLFKVVPKDFPPFLMRVAQAGNKGIHSAENNALLGHYFRQKLGIPSGTFITKEMLEKYGKTYVVFKKYENDIYLLDF